MTRPIQCDNCGAVLLKADLFCGECGAPHPSTIASSQAMEESPPDLLPDTPPVSRPGSDTAWRVAAVVLGIVGALVCLVGFATFLLFGLTESEGLTQGENWLFSTICCLVPIAGTGTALALVGLVIWWARLRNR
jgi:hypothetical protein